MYSILESEVSQMVRIFSAHLQAGHSGTSHEHIMAIQYEALIKLQDEVNSVLAENPAGKVQWLQNANASTQGHFVQLTAIVTY